MEWKDVGKAVGKLGAGLLGNALAASPVGGLINVVADVLGLGADPSPDDMMEAISADPEAAVKLLTVQDNNRVEIQRISLQGDQAFLADRQNARMRQVESEKATGKRDYNLYALSWLIVLGFFGLVALLCFRALPNDSNGVIFMLFGSLATQFGMVGQYFFGSSKSSADKTTMLQKGDGGKS